ncbi:MAG: hypothetical protein QXO66_00825 [Thermofilum sp.]
MSAAQKVIVVAGPKGAGKSTLIKALFPELPVRFAEPFLYRVYETSKGCRIVEVQAKDEALRVLLAAPPWRISVGIALVDATQQVAVNPLVVSLFAEAPAKALVLNKADQAPPERVREAQREAERLGMEFFALSAASGQGVEELRAWIQTGERPRAAPPAPAPAPLAPPPSRTAPFPVDLVPVPSGKEPRKGELSEEELRFLRACDGERSLSELASALGLPYGKAKSIVDKLFFTGYLRELRVRSRV